MSSIPLKFCNRSCWVILHIFWLRSWLCCPRPGLLQGCCEYTATHSRNICDSPPPVSRSALCVPGPAFSPDLDQGRRDGSTAELCSGQASSSTENICLTVGPQNMDPLMEVRPREQCFWCGESYSRNCCASLNLKTLYQHLSWSLLKFKELKSVNKLAYQACFSVVNPGLVYRQHMNN